MKKIKSLKGGSLSSTDLYKNKKKYFVRKKISLKFNREFGFQRWLSQMKKIQNYNSRINNIFPRILSSGSNSKYAYFDINFYKDSVNCFDYLNQKKKINTKKYLKILLRETEKLYKIKNQSLVGNIELYFEEEVLNRLNIFRSDKNVRAFIKYNKIYFNNEEFNQLYKNMNFLKKIFFENKYLIKETFVHGNLTLENILINKNKIIFIDPYEENYVDTLLNDFSQILQSCNSNYELLNKSKFKILKNKVIVRFNPSFNMKNFNKLFKEYLKKNFSFNEIMLIRAFEVTQFIRMIPFKLAINKPKALLFYALACKLLDELKYDYKNKRKF